MLRRISRLLNVVMGAMAGTFLGKIVFDYLHFKRNPGLYETFSAPWYTGAVLYGAVVLTALVILVIIKLLVGRELRRRG